MKKIRNNPKIASSHLKFLLLFPAGTASISLPVWDQFHNLYFLVSRKTPAKIFNQKEGRGRREVKVRARGSHQRWNLKKKESISYYTTTEELKLGNNLQIRLLGKNVEKKIKNFLAIENRSLSLS